jgi:hypothetical protein
MIQGCALLATVTGLTPSVSYAIPSAGTYEVAGGLSGTFTSTGSSLSQWNFIATPILWRDSNPNEIHIANDSNTFHAFYQGVRVIIDWNSISNAQFAYTVEASVPTQFPNQFQRVTTQGVATIVNNVPEPSGLTLLGLGVGLLAFVDYRWRQRRQAEVELV